MNASNNSKGGNKPKRVCFIRHQAYPPIPTTRNAEALVSQGYEVDLLCLRKKGEKKHEVIRGVNVYRIPIQHRRSNILGYTFEYLASFFLMFWKLLGLFMKKRYQVVEVDNMPDFFVFSAFIPKLMGAKIILNVLDHMSGVYADGAGVSPNHPIVKFLSLVEKVSASWVNHVIVTQSTSKEILERSGIPASKITVILNSPDEDVFKPQTSASDADGHFCLITHGTLVERYNVQTLIRAIPLLQQEIPNLEVKIVGDGEYRPSLEKLAESLGVTKYVTFTGRIPTDQVPMHISQAHVGIVVIPSGMNPAMPNKLLEYLALDKPVVVTSILTIKAYFDDSSVMYYEPNNENDLARCVLDLYRDPQKRKLLAETSNSNYQKYRWSVMKHEYLKVIEQLAEPRKRQTPTGN